MDVCLPPSPVLPARPKRPGRFSIIGPILFYDMIRTAAASIPDLDVELLELLLHCVVAHLKTPEWGSTL